MPQVFSSPQATYSPYLVGKYETKPGLKPFGFDFGNGEMDQRVFQCDRNWKRYCDEKMSAAWLYPERHMLTHNCPRAVFDEITKFIESRLAVEYPGVFDFSGGLVDPWMSIGLSLQEDLAITIVDGDKDWLAAIHVCLPAPWAPEEKIGKSFKTLHASIPGMEKIASKGAGFAKMMVEATDGFVRFVWGIASSDSLNKHPTYRPQPEFRRDRRRCFVRVERQGIWGFPEVGASLFTIRPYFYDMFELIKDEQHRQALWSAVEGMSPEEIGYKIGSAEQREVLLEWLSVD